MGTMNFSIPDDVKDKFNEVFGDRNKSEIITRLMQSAIEEEERRRRGEEFLARIRRIRGQASRFYTDDEIREMREELRK